MLNAFIIPEWSVPNHIKAISTTRIGGFSQTPFHSLNLADHVGDQPNDVAKNRALLVKQAQLPETARWLSQVHGTSVINSDKWHNNIKADGMVSKSVHHVCAIMTADCLPILLCNQQGDSVAALHAGWRGLATGIIEQAITKFDCPTKQIIAWLGPAIGPTKFEVGTDVLHAFTSTMPDAHLAFTQIDHQHYLADIYLLARQRLTSLGISTITGGNFCTASDESRFFSYRRNAITGRMASMIWICPN